MNDYIAKLLIGSMTMICFAGILAGSQKPSTPKRKPVKPDVVYVMRGGKVVGAASAVPYTKDGNIEQIYVPEAILESVEDKK